MRGPALAAIGQCKLPLRRRQRRVRRGGGADGRRAHGAVAGALPARRAAAGAARRPAAQAGRQAHRAQVRMALLALYSVFFNWDSMDSTETIGGTGKVS